MKILVWLSIGLEPCLLAVRAISKVLIWSNKANTTIDTAAVAYRLKSSERLNVFLDHFEAVLAQVWKSFSKSTEGTI